MSATPTNQLYSSPLLFSYSYLAPVGPVFTPTDHPPSTLLRFTSSRTSLVCHFFCSEVQRAFIRYYLAFVCALLFLFTFCYCLMAPSMGDDVDFVPEVDSPTPEAAPGFETKPLPHVQVEDEPHVQDETPIRRITPRPSFLENLADSRDRQFMLHRRASTDVDRYFVCLAPPSNWRDRTNNRCSMALETSTNTPNGPSSSVFMAASCPNWSSPSPALPCGRP